MKGAEMDLDRITHPLRLAQGSHKPGSGKGCAMNVISYINGDSKITDYPTCSARPLAALVQMCNDMLAGDDGYLSPENSVLVLDLGWQTVGTAGVSDAVVHSWMAEVLDNPKWGVIRFAQNDGIPAITNIAKMHRQVARGEIQSSAAKSAAKSAAWSAAWYAAESAAWSAAAWSAARYAAWSAAWSVAESAAARYAAESAAARYAAESAAAARYAAKPAAIVEFTKRAISCWRELAELNDPGTIQIDAVDYAFARINK